MEETNKRSFWGRTADFFLGPQVPEQFSEQQGSVGSAGGTSPLIGVTPPSRPTGPVLDARTALTITPVYASVDLIKNGVSQLPLAVQKNGKDLPVPPLVSKPDVRTTQTQFLSQTAGSLATYGNAYWLLHRAVEGPYEAVSSVEVMNPELMSIGWENGRPVYHYGDRQLADWQVKHLMVFPQFAPGSTVIQGLGPIQAGSRMLQAVLELESYLADYYRKSGVPTGVLYSEFALGQDDADDMRTRWYEVDAQSGLQVLTEGLKYQQIQSDPSKAMYHQTAQKAVVDVARLFRIPDRYLLAAVDGTSMTYTNMRDVDAQFIRYTLTAYLTAIEDAFSELLPRGQRAKFNIDAFLRGSTRDRYEAHKVAIDAGFMTVNEVRALEDLAPIATPKPPVVAPNPEEGDAPED